MAGVEDRVAIVTGGASGIGDGIVRHLVQGGAKVVISDVNAEAGQALARELGDRTLFLRHDVAEESGWQQVIEEAVARFGALHILVNNAGIGPRDNIETMPFAEWRRQFSVHADGPFLGCKYAFPKMLEAGYGRIVNMSSIGAQLGYSVLLAYGSAKCAQEGMTRSIAAHCRENGYPITCNAIRPGGILTPMVNEQYDLLPAENRAKLEAYKARTGLPLDIANAVNFLASEESHYISGQILTIDGAMTLSVNSRHDDRLGPGFDFARS